RELLYHRKELGMFADDIEQYIESLRQSRERMNIASHISELPDGRSIAVVNHPMANGGWVSTHEDVTERLRAEKQIAHLERHDALTNLPNRAFFQERLGQALATTTRGERIAVLLLGLDQFKSVNETLGHHMGDELLKIVAGRLRNTIREVDIVARVG